VQIGDPASIIDEDGAQVTDGFADHLTFHEHGRMKERSLVISAFGKFVPTMNLEGGHVRWFRRLRQVGDPQGAVAARVQDQCIKRSARLAVLLMDRLICGLGLPLTLSSLAAAMSESRMGLLYGV